MQQLIAPLAKLDIASVYGTEGQEFESLTVHQGDLEKGSLFVLRKNFNPLFFSILVCDNGLFDQRIAA